jgi:hypothetical protein
VQARKALPSVTQFIVLGVGRSANVFEGSDIGLDTCACLKQLSWDGVAECFPTESVAELKSYLAWKSQYSGRAP